MTAPYDTIDDLTRRTRRWIVVETLLFETLGRWARDSADPAVKRTLATWCHRHAWHAELWRDRLPVIADRADPDDDVDEWLEPLRAALVDTDAADALTVLADPVLKAVEVAMAEHRDAIDPVLDGPTARILDLVNADLAAELGELRTLPR